MSNLGQVAGAIAGAAIGFFLAPVGAVLAWSMVGFSIGMAIGSALFPTQGESPSPASGVKAQSSQYGKPIPYMRGQDKIAGNLIWYGDFKKKKQKSGGKGGGSQTTGYTYSVGLAWGLCIVPPGESVTLLGAWEGSEPMSTTNFRFYDGSQTTADDYLGKNTIINGSKVAMVARQPVWKNLCYVVIPNHQLGSGTYIKNMTFEIKIGSAADVSPTVITTDILTNDLFGLGLDAALLDSTAATATDTYCAANDLLMTPVFDRQVSVLDALRHVIAHHDGYITYSDGKIAHKQLQKNTTPSITIRTKNMVRNPGEMPAQASYQGGRDYVNKMTVEYSKRAAEYMIGTAPIEDQVDIDNYGLRDKTISLPGLKTHSRAAKMALLLLRKNLSAPQSIEFTVGPELAGVAPGDVFNVTVPEMEILGEEYRAGAISEDDNYRTVVSAIAEPDVYDLFTLTTDTSTPSAPVALNADPLSVVRPMLVEVPVIYSPSVAILAISYSQSTSSSWAGAVVYRSAYSAYEEIATQPGSGVTGAVTAIGAGTIDVLVDWDATLESMASFDELVVDYLRNVMVIDTATGHRFIRFQTVALIADNEWRLSDLVDDMVGVPVPGRVSSAIAVADDVAFIDDVPHSLPLDGISAGTVEDYKIASFNFAGTIQSLDAVTAITQTYLNTFNRPLPVQNIAINGIGGNATIDTADNAILTWQSCNRAGAGRTNYTRSDATPEDADFVKFSVSIYDGATLLRTAEVTASTYTYTAAMRTADSGGTTLSASISKIGSTETSSAQTVTITYA